MLTDDTRALLEAGSALIVGLVGADGRPHATRACGLDIGADGTTATLLMDEADVAPLGLEPGDAPGMAIAVTAADVLTLASVQVKGMLLAVEAAGPDDLARKDRYCDEFCGAIQAVDGISRRLAERWRPVAVVRCRLSLDEVFLQTPGPGAGASLGTVGR